MEPTHPSSDAVEELTELLHWLARRRSPQELLSPDGERLARAVGAEPGDPSAISSIIDGAIDDMDADAFQRSVRWLVGSGPLRWEAVKSRQHRAAQEFGVKTDAFRRRRSQGRPSREVEVLGQLARAIVQEQLSRPAAANGSGPVGSVGATGPAPDPLPEPAGDPATTNRMAVVMAAVVAVVALRWLVTRRSSDN